MKYKNAIMSLGILVALILSPFIGIPRSWKEGIAIILGLLVSILTYIGTRSKAISQQTVSAESYPIESQATSLPDDVATNRE